MKKLFAALAELFVVEFALAAHYTDLFSENIHGPMQTADRSERDKHGRIVPFCTV